MMLRHWLVVAILLVNIGSVNAEANWREKYREQVEVNIAQEDKINKLEKENIQYKIEKNSRYIFKVPFTDIGITGDHCSGFIVGALVVIII